MKRTELSGFSGAHFLKGNITGWERERTGNNSGKKIIKIIRVTDDYGIWYHSEINILKIGQAEKEKLSAFFPK